MRGFVTLATGNVKYYNMALNMLNSFRIHNPDVPFAIVCDRENDPWETENLAEKEKYKETVKQYRQAILTHRDTWEEQKHPWGKVFWGEVLKCLFLVINSQYFVSS
ncbi:MAG: hypothetical protein E7535_06555 [Ruminococcaceae bacterium]|nr:hypothetical protein [Oscillospiraceae bacterium]